MRTLPAIGLGLACFGLGVLTTKWIDDSERGSADGSSRSESPDEPERRSTGNGRSPQPLAVNEIVALVDVLDNHKSMQAFVPHLEGMTTEDLKSLLFRIERETAEPTRGIAIKLVIGHLARSDPLSAIRFATDAKNSRFTSSVVGTAIAELVRDSPQLALDAVLEIKSAFLRKDAMSRFVHHLSRGHPEQIREWMENEDVRKHLFAEPWSMRRSLEAWASGSPEQAAKFAQNLPNGPLRQQGVAGVATRWVQDDPAAVLEWVETLGDKVLRRHAINNLMGELVAKQPEKAFALLEASEEDDRKRVVGSIASAMLRNDPIGALEWMATLEDLGELTRALGSMQEWNFADGTAERFIALLEKLPAQQREEAGRHLIPRWASNDLKAASDWVASIDDPKEQNEYVRQMINQYSHDDPGAAVELIKRFGGTLANADSYIDKAFSGLAARDMELARAAVEEIANERTRTLAMQGVVRTWARNEPEAAADYVLTEFKAGPDRRRFLNSVTGEWAFRDGKGALAWASSLEGGTRVTASDEIIRRLSNDGSKELAHEALTNLLNEFPEESSKAGRLTAAISSVMYNVGEEDPAAGIAIINLLTTEQAQKSAITTLVSSWSGTNLNDAREWVAQLEPGPVRDNAVVQISWKLANEDSAAAFDLGSSLEKNHGSRLKVLRKAVTTWATKDADAAREAVLSAELTDAERTDLLDRIE